MSMKLYVGSITDKGNYREKNQDRTVCHMAERKGNVLAVACVCDGIGSFERSEIASEMLTGGVDRWFQGTKGYFPEVMDEGALVEDLEITIRELNELIYDYRREHGIDIGCTMSLLLLVDRNYYVFHAGDSRIYLIRDAMYQITRDEVVMKEADGRVKPRLANYVGKARELWMNRIRGELDGKTAFLLGSDGLFKRLAYEDVAEAAGRVKSSRHARKACEKFLELVLERGERDNVSCVLVCAAL